MLGTPAHTLTPTVTAPGATDAGTLGAPMPVPVLQPSSLDGSPTDPRRGAALTRRDVDELDSTPGFARHTFGFLLGLLLTPAGVVPLGLGLARLDAVAGRAGLGAGMLDVGLLAGGVGALTCLALLGAWSPALPITGGLVWGIGAGAAAMVWPGFTADLLASVVGDGTAPTAQLARSLTSGDLVVVGALLLAAGAAAGVGRRHGRRRAERMAAGRRVGARATAGGPAHSRA